jgi:hypothetical protein
MQGASTSSIPTAGEGLGHLVSEVGELCLAKKALFCCSRRRLKIEDWRTLVPKINAENAVVRHVT